MDDAFDRFLAGALAPPERDPDRLFVRRVQARIALDARLRAERGALVAALGLKILGLAAVAGGLAWLARSPAVAGMAAESPAFVLALIVAAFALLLPLLGAKTSAGASLRIAGRAFSRL